MKYTVCYISDRAGAVTLEAPSARRAAWDFLERFPRSDESQITVESIPQGEITHYRAGDLAGTPTPEDVEQGLIGFEVDCSREAYISVSGNREALRALGDGILKGLDKTAAPADAATAKGRDVLSVPVVPGDGSRRETYLSFKLDDDVARFWSRRHSARGWWTEYGRCLSLLVLLALAAVGVWTLARMLF